MFFAGETDRLDHDANALISTFGLGMVVFGLALTWFGLRSATSWAWRALWAWPVFFIAHVALLGTVVPDLVFAVLFASGLWLNRPGPRLPSRLS